MTILPFHRRVAVGDSNDSKTHHSMKRRRYRKPGSNNSSSNSLLFISLLVMSATMMMMSSSFSLKVPSISYRYGRSTASSSAFLSYTRETMKRKYCPPPRLATRIHLASLSTKSSSSSTTSSSPQKQIDLIHKAKYHDKAHHNDNDDATITANPILSTAKKDVNDNDQQQNNDEHYKHLFTLSLPEGTCVVLRLSPTEKENDDDDELSPKAISKNDNHWIKSILHPKEIAFATENLKLSKITRSTFFIGRIAMRHALYIIASNPPTTKNIIKLPMVSKDDVCILKDVHGRPTMPDGYLGSISHKKVTGVALVSHDDGDDNSFHTEKRSLKRGIGVDIEQTCSKHRSIAQRVLTEREIGNLGYIEGVTKEEEVLLRFSLKESVYKAMHPLINQYVGFQEAEITPLPDGTANVWLNLTSKAHEQFQTITAHWQRLELGNGNDGGDEFFLTSASVSLKTPLEKKENAEKDDCK